MGLSRPSGPVYGAKGLLWAVGPATGSTNASTSRPFANASHIVVPNYEDWFVTEFHAGISTCSSAGNSVILKSKGGSTNIPPPPWSSSTGATPTSTITQTIVTLNTGTSTSLSTWATAPVAPAGEYEGSWVPAGSTLYVVSSAVNPPGLLNWQVYGFIRFRNSTRSEG